MVLGCAPVTRGMFHDQTHPSSLSNSMHPPLSFPLSRFDTVFPFLCLLPPGSFGRCTPPRGSIQTGGYRADTRPLVEHPRKAFVKPRHQGGGTLRHPLEPSFLQQQSFGGMPASQPASHRVATKDNERVHESMPGSCN